MPDTPTNFPTQFKSQPQYTRAAHKYLRAVIECLHQRPELRCQRCSSVSTFKRSAWGDVEFRISPLDATVTISFSGKADDKPQLFLQARRDPKTPLDLTLEPDKAAERIAQVIRPWCGTGAKRRAGQSAASMIDSPNHLRVEGEGMGRCQH